MSENGKTAAPTEEDVREALGDVIDPELGWDIINLGLVYQILVEDGHVQVVMTLTTPGCPMGDAITRGVEQVLQGLPGVKSVSVDIVWSPRWDPSMMSDAAKKAFRIG